MIYTVFNTLADNSTQWQAELLEYSWGRVRQPGELVHLVSKGPNTRPSQLNHAHVVETLNWSPHPYTEDDYPRYNIAASLLEWQFVEPVDGAVLLLESSCVFRSAVTEEILPGQAHGTAWSGLPYGDGPFGLASRFSFLENYCVDRTLALPAVTMPLLIHSVDLRRIAARWLELTSIIRAETADSAQGPSRDADRIALVISAAEAEIDATVTDLGIATDSEDNGAPVLDYGRPIKLMDGESRWDPRTYAAWEPVDSIQAEHRAGQEILAMLGEYVSRRETGGAFAFLRPCRRKGVREGRILDRLFIDIPGRSDTLSLNASGATIWDLCDGSRDLAEVARNIEERFGMAPGSVHADVQSVIERLKTVGALELKPV